METPQANGNVLIISMLLELWCANERMPCKVKLPSIHQQMKDSLCIALNQMRLLLVAAGMHGVAKTVRGKH